MYSMEAGRNTKPENTFRVDCATARGRRGITGDENKTKTNKKHTIQTQDALRKIKIKRFSKKKDQTKEKEEHKRRKSIYFQVERNG